MSFTAPRFTDEGKMLQAKAQAGTELKFTKMQLGDGELGSQAIAAMTGLVNPLITVGISSVKAGNNYATVKSNFSNSGLTTGFFWREIGVFAENPEKPNDRNSDILYCYANAGSLAEYIPAAGSEIVEKVISIPCIIGDAENVSAEVASEIYATKEELKEHIDNKNNPHGVTAEQVGALTDESLKKEIILNKINVLDIEHGGTGANTRKEAFGNLAFLGNNPISSPSEDKVPKWCELGSGYAWYTTDGLLINQPFQYMFVINYIQDKDVFQIGYEQKVGTIYYRGGNYSGWIMNWTPLFGANSIVPIANGGTGKTTRKEAFHDLAFLGYSPVYEQSVDTPQKWGELGTGYTWYTTDGLLINQPYQYMFIINYTMDSDVFQIGSNQKTGTVYCRTGNGSGWITNWTPLLSTNDKTLLATTVQNLMQDGSISTVRSVQRGTANLSNDSASTTSVNISSVNTDKSVLLIDGQSGNMSSNNASGKIKDSTTLEFKPTNARSKNVINWKVVEYY